jgi:sugar lactone lactonase YvrE
MAIQVSGTEVISNARELSNIASVDATTVTSLNDAGVGGGFKPVSVSGATQALDVGTYNFFDGGTLNADTTISFTSVPTDALWTYTAEVGASGGYALNTATYNGINKSVSSESTTPQEVKFKPDGLTMYVMDYSATRTVFQYTLATAWNVGTATYASLSFSVVGQEGEPTCVTFSADGTKMYTAGDQQNTVFQYTLGTAWNVSTASYASLSKSVSAQGTFPSSVEFSPDGLKMYVVCRGGQAIFQYTLGTAWNVSTASYASLSISTSAVDTDPHSMALSVDGTKMFLCGNNNDKIFQYNLGTAFNISTATYSGISFSTSSLDSAPQGVTFSSDGSDMYIVGWSSDRVYQMDTSVISTISIPASVQNPPSLVFAITDQISFTFVTNDGGTTVKLINKTVL